MKIIALLTAAAAASIAVAAPAAAAPEAQRTTVTRTHTTVAYDQRHHNGRKAYWRKVCTNKWRNHHRVRVCRKVRAWR